MPALCPEAAILHRKITQIIGLIPEKFVDRDVLIRSLKSKQGSIPFTTSGGIVGRRREVEGVLTTWLPGSNPPAWVGEIQKVMSAET
jgi:hypothetical protein